MVKTGRISLRGDAERMGNEADAERRNGVVCLGLDFGVDSGSVLEVEERLSWTSREPKVAGSKEGFIHARECINCREAWAK